MALKTAVFCARSEDLFVSVGAWDSYHFSYIRLLVTSLDDVVEATTFDGLAQDLSLYATRAWPNDEPQDA